ncbi:hypothetical protein [Butyrivibrio virus Ceridwen]|nr:hypothetical protein [Butyrivibrio virus Ceridwen]
MSELKTLVSCKPSEFLRQTNKIKKSVEKWLTDTDILNIRKRMPALEAVPISATEEERKAIAERNRKLTSEQVKKNLSAILDAILEEHPEETMEILGLCCFVEPDHVDDYKVADYLTALNSLISDKVVLDFFTSLASLGQMNISDVSKA